MNKKLINVFGLLLVSIMVLTACGQPTPVPTQIPTAVPTTVLPTKAPTVAPTATPAVTADVLYVNILWHQHQPLYYKNPDGIYSRPWVRVHATKDYYDMAAVVAKYAGVKVTFNLTPVLIRQLDDYAAGAKDLYWVLAEKPADKLTTEDKTFILQRFYDANWKKIIARFPRYQELLDKRGGSDEKAIAEAVKSFTEQDFRDLQFWFNLAWFDPDFLAEAPLKGLVEKGKGFTETDKKILFDKTLDVIKKVIPLHKELQDKGQIEVITTPYSHPILPLLVDSNLAGKGSPGMDLPARFSYPVDAPAHLEKSVQIYKDHYGKLPAGLWPGEGSVAQAIVPYVLKSGYSWMATGEPVLSKSINLNFTRDTKETVQQADELYRPYYVQNANGDNLAVFFRDGVISDKVGFTYSGLPGGVAAKDLMNRLENIRARLKEQGAKGPNVVSIILDGENAWENYDNDGKEFFDALYKGLAESKTLKTITPSEYIKQFPEQKVIKDLFPAAWFQPNFETWIGESEENKAWEVLGKVREVLGKYEGGLRQTTPEALAKARDFMYLAEGSDWFWWYGSDQDSGQDTYFDEGFRALLAEVFKALGEPVPAYVNIPIIEPKPVASSTPLQGISTPIIDGKTDAKEWEKAANYPAEGQSPSTGFAYTLDAKNLYVKVDLGKSLAAVERIGFYLSVPRAKTNFPFTRAKDKEPTVLTGIAATHLVEWAGKPQLTIYSASTDGWSNPVIAGTAAAGIPYEFAIPLAALGELEPGDDLRMVMAVQPQNQLLPKGGPGQIILPDLTQSKPILEVADPENDDYGPGTYTYPTDAVFPTKAYDIKEFKVSADEKNILFKFTFYGAVPNPWGSGNNLAIQTLDVYVDKDPGTGTGARLLLPGRNAALTKENGWDFAIWAEGWTPQIVVPDAKTGSPVELTGASFKILVDPAARSVLLRVPKAVFGDGDPTKWGYAAVVLGQEGYPSAGVWRVRDVEEKNAQWRFGGAPADTNHTRIIDLVWQGDKTPNQKEILGKYPSSKTEVGTLKPDDFAQIPLLKP